MYPIVRVVKEYLSASKMPPLTALEAHTSHHRCWPQDIDQYLEMNNGRILSILDIGRTGLAARVGLITALRQNHRRQFIALPQAHPPLCKIPHA